MDVVLVEPQIPQNVGSIARSCAATITPLHIVGKIPFQIDEKKVRRAGLDYWPWVELHMHDSLAKYSETFKPNKIWLLSKFGKRIYYKADFSENDALVFGSETTGLSEELISQFGALDYDNLLTIPMPCLEVRSLNLSNAVSVVLFEARRQIGVDKMGRWERERK